MEKIIKAGSVKGQVYMNLYNRSHYYSVTDFYKNPSSDKRSAEKGIISQPECTGYKVLRGNCYSFTAGWLDKQNNLHIETASSSYVIIA